MTNKRLSFKRLLLLFALAALCSGKVLCVAAEKDGKTADQNPPAPAATDEPQKKTEPANDNKPPQDKKSAALSAARKDAWRAKTVIIPVTGVIGPESAGGAEEKIIQAVQDAETASRIVLEIDSPGGLVSSCDSICGALLKSKVPVTALVLRKAVSGGAMVATAAKQIYMCNGSRIGDVQPMNMMPGQQMDERTAEKIEADVRAIMAANARANGYPPQLLEAMVSRSLQIYEVKFEDGTREFLKKEQYELLRKNMEQGIDKRKFAEGPGPQVVDEEGKLLSLSAQDAVRFGLCTKVVKDEAEFFQELKIKPEDVVRADIPEGEFDVVKALGLKSADLSKWMIILLIVSLVAGIGGTLTEMHTPGFGLPGAVGIIGFSSFFYILFMHGRATPFEIALFVIGIALVVVEIVLLPGFGVPGIIGGVCLLLGLGLALLPEFDSPQMKEHFWAEITFSSGFTLAALVMGLVLLIFILERGAKVPFLKGIFLAADCPSGRAVIDEARATPVADAQYNPDERTAYLGKEGTAATTLRPAGKVKLDNGETIDVVTGGEYIELGSRVRVSAVEMNHIQVTSLN